MVSRSLLLLLHLLLVLIKDSVKHIVLGACENIEKREKTLLYIVKKKLQEI